MDSDYIFISGDLNFRINLNFEEVIAKCYQVQKFREDNLDVEGDKILF